MVQYFFTGNLSKETYKTKRIIDYTYGDWYWYHDKKIHTGYVYNNVSMKKFEVMFSNYGKMHGKLKKLFDALVKKFKSLGKVVKENNGAAVISMKNNRTAFIYLEEKKVKIQYGNLGDASKLVIDKYKDAAEDEENYTTVYEYLNDDFTEDIDSTVVDPILDAL